MESKRKISKKIKLLQERLGPTKTISKQQKHSRQINGIPTDKYQIYVYHNHSTKRLNNVYLCTHSHCNAVFEKSGNFRNHYLMHLGQKPFRCPVCYQEFSQKGNFECHFKKMHVDNKPADFIEFEKFLDCKTGSSEQLETHLKYSMDVNSCLQKYCCINIDSNMTSQQQRCQKIF